ncbi:nucleotidyl transferase AbiEii/AbiGii toxin family protein [Streptomyces xantholiticus]|uniref:nucleotidyl transferase AbiEii/AbiGii toxin family protein n=1 Tax=Streptomyces xantholiticus TaxID=68285 RepID=UPI0019B55C0C|nr:nucleotidyl transferase AbiEii/AbiGii toxin family protein [Streptomyces xantholiticus]GGW25141.1 hypothetical protein GCM10010381_05780 [Streptomyces xantholiticus]
MQQARRAALDHVLRLIADAPWSSGLVLRGSMTLTAWLGAAAREPGDLDFVVLEPGESSTVDRLAPFPYVDLLRDVQQWPEAADGAAEPELWLPEGEFGTYGTRPRLPPEGLRWMDADDFECESPSTGLYETVAADPHAGGGVVLDAGGIREVGTWMYRVYETPGVRLTVPYRTADGEAGEIQLDFASDETLPEAPVWTAVPRGDGGPPTVWATASAGLSLAWKLLWLCSDGVARGKDLYDAVLLAESPRTRLGPRLLRTVLGEHTADFGPLLLRSLLVDRDAFRAAYPAVEGDAEHWCERLATALTPLCAALRRSA